MLAGPALSAISSTSIKYLGNELQIPIVAVGTRDAFNAVQTDPQLPNRFEPKLLRRWTMSDDYLRLLASFEVAFALARPSKLAERTLAQKILNLSEGTIGEISAAVNLRGASRDRMRNRNHHERFNRSVRLRPSARASLSVSVRL